MTDFIPRGGRPPTMARIRLFQEIGRRLDARGFIASNDGNLSLRDEDGSVLITSAGSRKGHLTPPEIVRISPDGTLLSGSRPSSSESAMHLLAYSLRPDVSAVVHAHPPVATGFAVARQPMDACVLPEIILSLGSIPVAPYGTPGTPELGKSLGPSLRDHDVVLLANHGAVALGADLEDAYFKMERLEHTARILLVAQLLGRVETLGRPEVERLLATDPSRKDSAIPCLPGPGRAESCATGRCADPPGPDRGRLTALILEVLERRGILPPEGVNNHAE